jgi:hypothetical protein
MGPARRGIPANRRRTLRLAARRPAGRSASARGLRDRLGDTAGAAATLRRAVAIDASTLGRLPISPELAARLQGLESAARVTTRQASADANDFFLLACWRSMLGRPTEAHFAATVAVERGDASDGTARLRDWLANVG